MKKFPEDFIKDLEAAKNAALPEIGALISGEAKRLCPVDTGRLRRSIGYSVDENSVSIGTNVEYAPDVEFGTTRIIVGTIENPRKARHVGYMPFLRPAIFQNKERIVKSINKKFKQMFG